MLVIVVARKTFYQVDRRNNALWLLRENNYER